MNGFLGGGIELRAAGALQPERVARHQAFAKADQLCPFGRGLVNGSEHFLHGGLAIQPYRGQLGECYCQGLLRHVFQPYRKANLSRKITARK
jgi:hypothetical protein